MIIINGRGFGVNIVVLAISVILRDYLQTQ